MLIIDDWAMARLTAEQRRDLMEVIDDRHQRASTILATQIPLAHLWMAAERLLGRSCDPLDEELIALMES